MDMETNSRYIVKWIQQAVKTVCVKLFWGFKTIFKNRLCMYVHICPEKHLKRDLLTVGTSRDWLELGSSKGVTFTFSFVDFLFFVFFGSKG